MCECVCVSVCLSDSVSLCPLRQSPLSSIPGLDAASLALSLKSFYAALFALAMPTFERLTAPRVRVRARRGTAQLIASAYVVSSHARVCVCVCLSVSQSVSPSLSLCMLF